jgi:hypothetical protein
MLTYAYSCARWKHKQGGKDWLPGKVLDWCVRDKEKTYKILYDDGDKEDAVKRGNIRTDTDKRLSGAGGCAEMEPAARESVTPPPAARESVTPPPAARESEAACASGVRESVTPPLQQSVTPPPAARQSEASISEAAATVHEASAESGHLIYIIHNYVHGVYIAVALY